MPAFLLLGTGSYTDCGDEGTETRVPFFRSKIGDTRGKSRLE